ncbi:MAG: type II toxin-antitoxin system VapB family antitoxin [Myxococcota bacterium]
MALNIKSDEAHELARRLAEATGTSMTDAVTVALKRTLDRQDEGPSLRAVLAEVRAIQDLVASLPDRDGRTEDAILGYDESGLPR